jgi:hypothetical protein
LFILLNLTGDPFLRLNSEIAKDQTLFGTLEYHSVDIPDSEKEKIINECAKMRIGWIPMLDYGGPPYFQNDQKLYISLVFEKQMFLHIFLLNDNTIIAYMHPFDNERGNYIIKNPEVLRNVIELVSTFPTDDQLNEANAEQ